MAAVPSKRNVLPIVAGLGVALVIAASTAAFYYYQYNDLATRVAGTPITVNVGINYADGRPTQWFNDTQTRLGASLYDVMQQLGWQMEVRTFPSVPGVFIDAINGVRNRDDTGTYWIYWYSTTFGLSEGPLAADKYLVSQGEAFIWYYSTFDATTGQSTPPP
jgi:hypothetical protein